MGKVDMVRRVESAHTRTAYAAYATLCLSWAYVGRDSNDVSRVCPPLSSLLHYPHAS
jgi:hypothetical protein